MMLITLMLAQAATPAPNQHASSPTPAQPTAKVECRMIMEAGSRIPTRVCRLDKEWELLARDAQDDINSSRNGHGLG